MTEGRPTDDPASLALVETRVGQPLSMTAVRASITHLFGLGRFQDVQVEAIDAPGGVALRYDLVPLHSVQRVDFRGTAGLSEGLLRQTMTNRFGTAPPVGRAPEIARMLEQLYREHGYLRATVRPRATELHDPDRTLLEFEVDAGSQARIGSVVIDGVPAEGRDAFLREVHALPSTPYEPPEITAGLADYVEKLRKRGRYLAAASYRPRPSEDATVVDLTIDLETGPVVTVAFRGDPLPQDKLAELAPIAREGSVDQDLIEDSIQRIKSYLNQQGYWKADASAERQEGQGTLTVAFTVRRGLPYRIADGVEVVGNQHVPLEQLRPALAKLQANDVFVESNLSAAVSGIAGHVSAARVRPRESGRRGQRAEPVSHGPGPGQAGHHHHGRAAHARRRRDVRRQRHRAAGAAPRGREIGARGAVLSAAGRGRLRRGAARIPEPRVRRRQRRRRARAVGGWDARRPQVSKSTRASRRSSTTSSSSATPAPIPRSSRASCCCRRASRSASRISSRASAGSARSDCSGASASTRCRTRAAAPPTCS